MYANDIHGAPAAQDRNRIALFTSDAVFALDIKQALESIGCSVWNPRHRDKDQVETAFPSDLAAAIVDLHVKESRSALPMIQRAMRDIPTIVIAANDGAKTEMPASPPIIGHFSKPFCVDCILPTVRRVLSGRSEA